MKSLSISTEKLESQENSTLKQIVEDALHSFCRGTHDSTLGCADYYIDYGDHGYADYIDVAYSDYQDYNDNN